jgi:hypothetical protein
LSPPIASRAIVRDALTVGSYPAKKRASGARGLRDLAAIIKPAGRTNVMWPLKFTAIRTFRVRVGRQCVMSAAHITLRFRYFILWNSHNRTISTVRETH